MHCLSTGVPPDRVELDPPPHEDHSTWIVGQGPRRPRPGSREGPAAELVPRAVAVRDCSWVTRLL